MVNKDNEEPKSKESGEPQKKESSAEPSSSSQPLPPLPPEWKLSLSNDNKKHAKQDFSAVVRCCNSRLQQMHAHGKKKQHKHNARAIIRKRWS